MKHVYEEIDLEHCGFCDICHELGIEERATFEYYNLDSKVNYCAYHKLMFYLSNVYLGDQVQYKEAIELSNKDIRLYFDYVRNRIFNELINNNVLDINNLNKYLNENNLTFIDNKVQVKEKK